MPEPVIIGNATLYQGDALEILPAIGNIDAVITDPPYGLSFMGKDWDHGIPGPTFWVEALRVAKPGAHLLAFGGSRTFHRLVCAIEDAGWEVRDVLMWVYGSGFPKSLDVSKALDKREGAERADAISGGHMGISIQGGDARNAKAQAYQHAMHGQLDKGRLSRGTPATAAARQWAGWGTALKPAYEPILLARKPLAGTVAGNVLAHGTGALNIDGCRVESGPSPAADRRMGKPTCQPGRYGATITDRTTPERWAAPRPGEQLGRFPANFIHDGSPEVLALFPETCPAKTGVRDPNGTMGYNGGAFGLPGVVSGHDDPGGSAARFFYCAKASQQDRDEGCAALTEQVIRITEGHGRGAINTSKGDGTGIRENHPRRNTHPTVKPIALMRYLCRLITPPDGIILDPFMGSGSTGKAALLEGFRFMGIEQDAEYLAIAAARIRAANEQPKQIDLLADAPAQPPARDPAPDL